MLFLSFMNLFRNYRRTLAILLTIALGTGVLFSFKGFINGVLNQYRESTIHSLYGHGQINTKHYRETVQEKPWMQWMANWEDLQAYLSAQEEVEHVFPRINFPALLKKDSQTVSGYGQGVDAGQEATFFYELNIVSGETLSFQEDGILLGIGLAQALNVQPGDSLTVLANSIEGKINQAELKVTGIFNTGSIDSDNRLFRIQLKQAQSLMQTSQIELIALGLRSHLDWDSFASNFEKAFPELEATSFAVLDKVYYQHSVDWLHAQYKVVQAIILSIVLLGIFNSVSAAILERKQEIGNFRANGESIADIMILIIAEGLFLGIIGSAFGIAFTFSILKLFLDNQLLMPPAPGNTLPFYISFEFEWQMVYFTMLLSVTASIAASLLAGLKVAKMPIAKALRAA
ncbi:ABC transporter permease [Candidatus Protochlamydia phocaeensis]|uniref:ABC transporter permease n=1 Tax=Candidatus Protochlamydia phocaeensis TaxID=1414722 RepID=UPI00083989C1|nr:FtsX-like permease family protein [Candidatus Protochlamydia phocaeensis]